MRPLNQVLVVGEDFGRSCPEYHSDQYALTGASGRRLADLSGLHYLDFYLATERTNVVELPEHWRDPERVDAGVRAIMARIMDQDPETTGLRRVVLLGVRVAREFGVRDAPLLAWDTVFVRRPGQLAVFEFARAPHPSGRSHWWNVPANVELARAFWTEALA